MLPAPSDLGVQVFHGPVPLGAVAVPAQQLVVLVVVAAALGPGDHVVDFQMLDAQLGAAAVAAAFLVLEQPFFHAPAVGFHPPDIGASGGTCPVHEIAEQAGVVRESFHH